MDPDENGTSIAAQALADDYRLTRIEAKIDAILGSNQNTEQRLTWVVNTVTSLIEIIKQIPMVSKMGMFPGMGGSDRG